MVCVKGAHYRGMPRGPHAPAQVRKVNCFCMSNLLKAPLPVPGPGSYRLKDTLSTL